MIKRNSSRLILSLIGAACIWLGAQFELTLPGTSIPQSGQTLVILLVAALLAKPYGILAVLFYLLSGLFGLPVFSDDGSGWEHLTGNTGGYLFGFLLAAVWVQLFDNKKHLLISFSHYLIGHIIILSFGWVWLSRFIGVEKAWQHGVNPFIFGALLKSLLALIIVYGCKLIIQDRTNIYGSKEI